MTKQLQFRRYANTALGTITGLDGELIVDKTNKTLTVHDGYTPGGSPLATEAYTQAYVAENIVSSTSANLVSGAYTASLSPIDGSFTVPGFINMGNPGATISTTYFGGGGLVTNANVADGFTYNLLNISNQYNQNLGDIYILSNGANTAEAYIDVNDGTTQRTFGFHPTGIFTLPNQSSIQDIPDGAYANGLIVTVNSNQTKFDTGGRTHFPNDLVINYGGITFLDTSYQTTAFTGSANLLSNTAGVTPYEVTLNQSGKLILPSGSIIDDTTINNSFFIKPPNTNYTLKLHSSDDNCGVDVQSTAVYILTNVNSSVRYWSFDADGYLNFPDSTAQYTAFTGTATDPTARTLSQSAYNQANAAFAQANNSGSGIVNAAFIQANAAFNQANISVGVDSTQNTNIQLAWNTANAAFNQANTDALLSYANIIFTQANAAFVEANIAATIIPQNAQSANYVLANTDAGKHLYYTNGSAVNLYLPWTSNTTFANGTTITIISHTSSNVTITPNTGVSMYLAGNTTSASRNVTTYGMATLIMTAANTWYINGTGVI